MEHLKWIKEKLEDCIVGQLERPERANTSEMTAVMDMLKDVTMAMYYCSIVHAMEEGTYNVSLSEKLLK